MAYQTINTIFQNNDSDLTASEAHGLATGMLCIDANVEVGNWLAELFTEQTVLIDEDKTILITLFEQTGHLLNGADDGFRYDLFLPSDHESLSEQLEAVRYWCEGFLFGIGYARSSSDWPDETGEIMRDIVEFTKMDTETDDGMDDQEKDEQQGALMEIQEYLRVSVMMIKEVLGEAAAESNQKH